MVLTVQSMGGDALLEVAFDNVGTKRMMLESGLPVYDQGIVRRRKHGGTGSHPSPLVFHVAGGKRPGNCGLVSGGCPVY
ncbi:MAG: hypothetical protein ACLS43_11740 [Evtepia gabavorous]